MWFSCRDISFGVAGVSFFEVYGTAGIMFAIVKLKDINIVPHRPKYKKSPVKFSPGFNSFVAFAISGL